MTPPDSPRGSSGQPYKAKKPGRPADATHPKGPLPLHKVTVGPAASAPVPSPRREAPSTVKPGFAGRQRLERKVGGFKAKPAFRATFADGPAQRPFRTAGPGPGVVIVFEDEDVLVLDKPAGMLTAGQYGETRETLFDHVKNYIRSAGGKRPARDRKDAIEKGLPRHAMQGVWIVHRLDKEASGLLVFAKSLRALETLKADFKSKRVHRMYSALVEGEIAPVGQGGTIQSFLRESEDGEVRNVANDEFRGNGGPESAKLAVTHYKVVAVGKGFSLLQVRLETGRKNQIRIHLSSQGHPLVGDPRFNSKADPVKRLGLHATELGFNHPATGLSVRYTSAPPASFFVAAGASPPVTAKGIGEEPAAETSWEPVAAWYDQLMSDKLSDHYEQVILPGILRLAQPGSSPDAPPEAAAGSWTGERVLDLACGQGIVSRRLAALGATVVGIDASPALIDAAKRKAAERTEFVLGDARAMVGVEGPFDAAVCVMGLTNIEPLSPLFARVAELLKPGGRFAAVIQHPAFRIADQTSWGWDDQKRRQYRRVDGYLSPSQKFVVMNPGKVAAGEAPVTTITFHRPLQAYFRLLGEAGLLVENVEEWTAQRSSTSGPRAAEENRSRAEIPLFLAWRCVKR